MKLPKLNEEVLVKLDTGHYAVAAFDGKEWYTGNAVWPSNENGIYSLSGKVTDWSLLPKQLTNKLKLTTKIFIYDELEDAIVISEGELDLKTGKISNVIYTEWNDSFNKNKDILPFYNPSYEKTSAELFINDKSIGFNIDTSNSSYLVNDDELKRIKKEINRLNNSTVEKIIGVSSVENELNIKKSKLKTK